MNELDELYRKIHHELLVIQRKMDVSLVAIGVGVGALVGLALGFLL